jgi:hypothetical protein
MGNWNSGRNNRGAGRCEAWHRVELKMLRKWGSLTPGTARILSWNSRGEPTGSIGFYAFHNHAELRFSCNGEDVVQHVSYRYTLTNFGGQRLRFECPRCWRPCDILYGGRRFYCRQCWRLTYHSQYDEWWERARSKAEKIRSKLGKPDFITPYDVYAFPDKPKWMRWRTYDRMRAEDARLMQSYDLGFCYSARALIERIDRRRR